MERIYIDEAGNTGQDLMNPEQKVFILASNNFSDSDLKTLSELFESTNELHFKKLKNSSRGRDSIIKFLNHDLISENNIICSTAHKEYVTVGQMVDQLMEPIFYNHNIDIYKYGQNISLTNFIYIYGTCFWDKTTFYNMLNSFVKMMRSKNELDINEFYKDVNNLYHSLNPKDKNLIIPLILSQNQISSILEGVKKFTLDLTLSSFYILCDLWHRKTKTNLLIIQDDSKQIEHFRSYIEFTKNLDLPKQEIGYGSRKIIFPTQIKDIELVNSEKNLGVQISDLIASSLGFMYNNINPKQNKFVCQIQNSKLLQLSNYHTIWPSSDVTPEKLKMTDRKGVNILDFLANEMIKKRIIIIGAIANLLTL